MKDATNIPDASDSWAQVELFRWQYGVLPTPTDRRILNVAEGLRKMSVALMEGCQTDATAEAKTNMPSPFNVCSVMQYAAKLLDFTPAVYSDNKPSGPRPMLAAGRNDPCPCGSGLKYKKCCLVKGA